MSKKKDLGQFYTTNYKYILSNFQIPETCTHIIEPFAGKGDLLKYIHEQNENINIEAYDLEPGNDQIIKNDSFENPPKYENMYVITNPPYLARNKSKNKSVFDKYKQNDLYKCFIYQLIENNVNGGILIIPLNFFCSVRKSDQELRKLFFNKYIINQLNIFEEKIFEDTSYNICSFQFDRKKDNNDVKTIIYPSKKCIYLNFNEQNNYMIGGELYELKQNKNIKIQRLTEKNKNNKNITTLLLKCIDNNQKNQIQLKFVENKDIYIDNTPNLSARSYASMIIEPSINIERQKELVNQFNVFLKENREKYHSLFLTNYRESNTIMRKRISFSFSFQIMNYLLSQEK
jgi:hypothetical protein